MDNSTTPISALPFPPLEMRRLVGPTDTAFFDNPNRSPIFDVPPDRYDYVVDFGCGCGRNARRMLQQIPRPKKYLGFDLHAGMINWCRKNLEPHAPNFTFAHHDIANPGLNPGVGKPSCREMPVESGTASLLIAWSVFTHTLQEQAEYYLRESSRVLAPHGEIVATFFLFEKRYFPMMQDFQNALYINTIDPTNAVIFDREWLQEQLSRVGLVITNATPPETRGFQWVLRLQRSRPGLSTVTLPEDKAPFGRKPPPLLSAGAHTLGQDG